MSITGAFFDGFSVDFSNGLNCIMGPRGTGKTTILELLRYALDAVPPSVRKEQVSSLLAANLGTGSILVEIVAADEMEYIITRTIDSTPIVKNRDGVILQVEVRSIFPCDFFGQGEIEGISIRAHEQLTRLIDDKSDDIATHVRQRSNLVSNHLSASIEIVALDRELNAIAEKIDTLSSSEIQLQQLQDELSRSPQADRNVIETAQKRRRDVDIEVSYIQTLESEFATIQDRLKKTVEQGKLFQHSEINAKDYNGTSHELLKECASILQKAVSEADKKLLEIFNDFVLASSEVSKKLEILKSEHSKSIQEFQAFLQQHNQFTGLSKKLIETKSKVDILIQLREKKNNLYASKNTVLEQRRQILLSIANLDKELFKVRTATSLALNAAVGNDVDVAIERGADRTGFSNVLQSALAGSKIHYRAIIEKITELFSPAEFVSRIRQRDTNAIANALKIDEGRALSIVEHVAGLGESTLSQIETTHLDDRPSISLSIKEAEGTRVLKQTHELSTGQRCTTILPILLCRGSFPLTIDQPEDNLDNDYVMSTIVKLLKEKQADRQLILITHNPNLPVLGGSLFNLFLQSDSRHGMKLIEGSLHHVKNHIIQYLEGGREAFAKRAAVYGDA